MGKLFSILILISLCFFCSYLFINYDKISDILNIGANSSIKRTYYVKKKIDIPAKEIAEVLPFGSYEILTEDSGGMSFSIRMSPSNLKELDSSPYVESYITSHNEENKN